MRAWLKRLYFSLRIRAIQRRLNLLGLEQRALQAAIDANNADLIRVSNDWKALKQLPGFPAPRVAESDSTTPPSSPSYGLREIVALAARPPGPLH